MSMSTHIRGVRDLGKNKQFDKMLQVKIACELAEIAYPQEVVNYFKYPKESVEYLTREMESIDIDKAVTKYNKDSTSGYEVVLDKLPKDVVSIKFENSW